MNGNETYHKDDTIQSVENLAQENPPAAEIQNEGTADAQSSLSAQQAAQTPDEQKGSEEMPPLTVPCLKKGTIFWLLFLSFVPVVGLVLSVIFSFAYRKKEAVTEFFRAVFLWKIIEISLLLILVIVCFVLRDRFGISNFLERILGYLLNFVRANAQRF